MSQDSVYICGCVMNCAKHIKKVFDNIHKIGGECFKNYHVLLFYDESSDNTLQLIHDEVSRLENAGDVGKMEVIINNQPTTPYRTKNIANGRNTLIQRVRSLNEELVVKGEIPWKYFIMIDMDDVCSHPVNVSSLLKYITEPEYTTPDGKWKWDALSFNRRPYYDLWALSFDPFMFSVWHWNGCKTRTEPRDIVERSIQHIMKNIKQDELFYCSSAFNGFAIYKTDIFVNCIYEWNILHTRVTREQMDKSVAAFRTHNPRLTPYINNDKLEDCEHRSFHLEAIQRYGAKVAISPLLLWDEPS